MSQSAAHDNHARKLHPRSGTLRISAAMEDYLKAIYHLQLADDRVTTLHLASELGVSSPSVTNMIKRLAELALAEHHRYYGVRLTHAGEMVALEVIRHHRLLELYLAEAMGYDWDKVHDEAERLEHHVSSEFEERMDELLGHPEYDPHGDPIPSKRGEVPSSEWHLLSDAAQGVLLVLRRVSDRDSDHLRFLAEIDVVPGSTFQMETQSTGGGYIIQTAAGRHAIPAELANQMQVETVSKT